jgi:hypothetical protein
MFGKMKKFGGKVRKFVRVVRASLPSVGIQSEETVNVRAAVTNVQDATVCFCYILFYYTDYTRPDANFPSDTISIQQPTPSP